MVATVCRTKIDRLGVSILDDGPTVTKGLLAVVFEKVGVPDYEIRNGAHGFQQAAVVTVGGAQVAYWLWGGASQKGRSFIDVSGLGCNLIDWEGNAPEALLGARGAKLKRVDIAADFYRGEVKYEDVKRAYQEGKFRTRRQPDYTEIRGSHGDTFYVGSRGNDVYLRAYEKGKKEFHELQRSEPELCRGQSIDCIRINDQEGLSVSLGDWFRVELELRAKTRPLPAEVIADRDLYFAGAYPFLQELLPQIEPRVLVRPEVIAEATLLKSLAHIREQYGPTLFTALTAYEGDIYRVWAKVCKVGHHNDKLVKAGALLLADKFSDEDA